MARPDTKEAEVHHSGPHWASSGKKDVLGKSAQQEQHQNKGRLAPQAQGANQQFLACKKGQCTVFKSAAGALAQSIRETQPQVIGFGEAHQRQGQAIVSTAQRFLKELFLPLSRHSSSLLLEILSPPDAGCPQKEEQVRKDTAQITRKQSGNNQADYIALGRKARSVGVKTELLEITCSDLEDLSTAGDETVLKTMNLIAKRSEEKIKEWLEDKPKGVVLSYGGALHNDLFPSEARKDWSYGPSLYEMTEGAYLEIDLVRAEALREDSPWLSLEGSDVLKESVKEFRQMGAVGAFLLRRKPGSYYLVLGVRP